MVFLHVTWGVLLPHSHFCLFHPYVACLLHATPWSERGEGAREGCRWSISLTGALTNPSMIQLQKPCFQKAFTQVILALETSDLASGGEEIWGGWAVESTDVSDATN